MMNARVGGIVAALLVAGLAQSAQAEAPAAAGEDATVIEWVSVAGGEFQMGANEKPDEKPPHQVRVKDFVLAKTEVTQAQWRAVTGENPSHFAGCDECPVENVSWEDIQSFFEKVKAAGGVAMRLPTEAEWEYAAGGGAAHQKWAGTERIEALAEYAWMDRVSESKTHPVAQKKPNQFGLHDMSGNVAEWVADWYDEAYYASSPAEDPTGPETGDRRVARGGSWWFSPAGNRIAFRMRFYPAESSYMLGFRPARD